ncbi:hypothetical protein OHAE_3067 [Ochrobactrum soli]|uniref:Uncharacterized protein n=1 Tax=Ochrobactrum soli TaxID=2448455 RepID=A0A2P9HGA1_9HYPH|nr:hypothetical protein OHAE_3067 [[Ochrobactrum] soli]
MPVGVVWSPEEPGMSWFLWFIGTMMVSLFALIGFTAWAERERD